MPCSLCMLPKQIGMETPEFACGMRQMAWSVVTLSADSDGIDGVDQPMHRAAINVSMVEGG
eukprot:2291787-Amphidinium_carterae.1